jgi:CRP-like cAMP-binding protein
VGATAGEMAAAPAVVVDTPLFQDFTAEELVEVIRGLRLRHFEAGEIVVTEGEPGASLFVLTTGTLRAYVRNAAGRNVKVRDLSEGDFFGEVSLLRGTGRTATLTAATWAELLEIDRDTLNAISQRHPRVWTVLKGFYDRRAGSTLEIAARGVQPDTGS